MKNNEINQQNEKPLFQGKVANLTEHVVDCEREPERADEPTKCQELLDDCRQRNTHFAESLHDDDNRVHHEKDCEAVLEVSLAEVYEPDKSVMPQTRDKKDYQYRRQDSDPSSRLAANPPQKQEVHVVNRRIPLAPEISDCVGLPESSGKPHRVGFTRKSTHHLFSFKVQFSTALLARDCQFLAILEILPI